MTTFYSIFHVELNWKVLRYSGTNVSSKRRNSLFNGFLLKISIRFFIKNSLWKSSQNHWIIPKYIQKYDEAIELKSIFSLSSYFFLPIRFPATRARNFSFSIESLYASIYSLFPLNFNPFFILWIFRSTRMQKVFSFNLLTIYRIVF